MSTSAVSDDTKENPRRRFRSKLERRLVVEETLKPGASVSRIARAHDVNANQVFQWRKQYHDGKLETGESPGALLPVKLEEIAVEKVRREPRQKTKLKFKRTGGIIHIDLGYVQIRIEGSADPQCVRAVMEGLVR